MGIGTLTQSPCLARALKRRPIHTNQMLSFHSLFQKNVSLKNRRHRIDYWNEAPIQQQMVELLRLGLIYEYWPVRYLLIYCCKWCNAYLVNWGQFPHGRFWLSTRCIWMWLFLAVRKLMTCLGCCKFWWYPSHRWSWPWQGLRSRDRYQHSWRHQFQYRLHHLMLWLNRLG